jgi:hypothetical protein
LKCMPADKAPYLTVKGCVAIDLSLGLAVG